MNVLIVGGGGREHALAWKIAQSPRVAKVFVAPGNAGTAREPGADERSDRRRSPTLVAFAQRESVALTIVGPEAPLAAGIVDAFRAAGLRIFGPTRAAAQLESSKDFAKAFMAAASDSDRRVRDVHRRRAARTRTSTSRGAPIVVKADGLAAGKGVVVAMDERRRARGRRHDAAGDAMGAAGARVVIEEFLDGEEASFIVMADGAHALALASSQDHKRLPTATRVRTPAAWAPIRRRRSSRRRCMRAIMREVIAPAVAGMAAEGMPYTGFLYAGVMIDAKGEPRVLEFNCRLGDPETQPIMVRLRSDLTVLVEHALAGTLDRVEAEWDRRTALTVVLAAAGYPDAPRRGDGIEGLDRVAPPAHADVTVFHAGTLAVDGHVKVNGGRVLGVTALGDSLRQAQRAAYAAVDEIRFDGMQFRTDIGHRALARRT